MQKLNTEILVIGGGATGTGAARDLAMRGFKSILVEKGDLTHGTTGRYHGLLHSGARYAVHDPYAARECMEENTILRRIMPHCIEDTGGFFVLTPWDPQEYAPKFVEGCQAAGIPVEEVPRDYMLWEEPLLNPRISLCYRVPDGSADSFLGAKANAQSARDYGAQILNYTKLTGLLLNGNQIIGARCHDLYKDEELEIHADLVVSAAGAWAGKVASSAGIEVKITPGKGVMLAVNHRIVHTVINRLKMPSDGDILVPAHTVSVIGTTDVPVKDPDRFGIEPWEVELMLQEGEKMVPGFKDMRFLRAWAGVRPLYQETSAHSNRELTRAYVLLDHEERDGISGFLTITGGKWTTYRRMAEDTVDLVCKKLKVERECRTHLEILPGSGAHGYHFLGSRLAQIEKNETYGNLVCECELATYEDVRDAIVKGQAKTIDDIRREVRLGMGPCQGGFCNFRAAGMLHELRQSSPEETNTALNDFLQERWKGLLPILWGKQLKQERLNELMYLSALNIDHLPWVHPSRLAPHKYEIDPTDVQPSASSKVAIHQEEAPEQTTPKKPMQISPSPAVDVLVVGGGLAGITAARQAARQGLRTRLVSKGLSSLFWSTGCIDVLGYYPGEGPDPVESPGEAVQRLVRENPNHPYALAGLKALQDALHELQVLSTEAGYPLVGSLEKNWLLPAASGAVRPTCLAPETMTGGDLRKRSPMLLVGFERFPDFYPRLAADNLRHLGIQIETAMVDPPILRQRRFITARILAAAFDQEDFREEFAGAIRPHLLGRSRQRIGLPAFIGLARSREAWQDLQGRLGCPVFEIPTLPPSIPGMRLHNLLSSAFLSAGGRFYDGMEGTGAVTDGLVQAVYTEAAARLKTHKANTFVLATGGLLGGGFEASPDGHLRELVFNLPIDIPHQRQDWFEADFLSKKGHPIYRSGITVNGELVPIDPQGNPYYNNLYAAGACLANFDPIQERSLEGTALATGWCAGNQAAQMPVRDGHHA
jgi:glycerol-3-phosphate dehydrogenase